MTSAGGPFTRDTIRAELERVHAESERYWATFATPTFLAPIGDAWSPADNVRHLTKSIRAVSQGLRMPRWLVRVVFGTASHASRSYEQIHTDYHAVLANGGKAGRFAPNPRPAPADVERERARIMAFHATAVGELCSAMSRWPERGLDRCRLPHPLLGRLTVREMLLFTLYHNRHHVEGVRARLAARSS